MIDTTIIIPAYKPAALLKQCLDSVIAYTDLTKVEIIIVCNGSDKETADYIISLNQPSISFIWYTEALGYPKATNIGMRLAKTPYLILLNSDAVVQPHQKHNWVERLTEPFKTNANLAITGVTCVWMWHRPFYPFAHVCLRKNVAEKLNYLDEAFSPGYGEDIDYCFRVADAGYDMLIVANNIPNEELRTNMSDFPLYHDGKGSFGRTGDVLQTRAYDMIYKKHILKISNYS